MRIQLINTITKSAFCLHFHGKKNHSYLRRRFNARLQSYPKTDSPPISAFDAIPMCNRISTCIEYRDYLCTAVLCCCQRQIKKPLPIKVEAFHNKGLRSDLFYITRSRAPHARLRFALRYSRVGRALLQYAHPAMANASRRLDYPTV